MDGGTARAHSNPVETLTWTRTRTTHTRATAQSRAAAAAHASDVRQAPIVLSLFLLIQLLDGMLTYWGVSRFGIELEMNTLLSGWMHQIGPAPTLFMAKALACGCGLVLYRAQYLRALAAVAGLCLGVAVVPWAFLIAAIG
jgi:hypothetical protein